MASKKLKNIFYTKYLPFCKMTSEITKLYWIGPAGILVPHYIDHIPDIDRCNIRYSDGSVTERGSINITAYTIETYRDKFAKCGEDGNYYWNIN